MILRDFNDDFIENIVADNNGTNNIGNIMVQKCPNFKTRMFYLIQEIA